MIRSNFGPQLVAILEININASESTPLFCKGNNPTPYLYLVLYIQSFSQSVSDLLTSFNTVHPRDKKLIRFEILQAKLNIEYYFMNIGTP